MRTVAAPVVVLAALLTASLGWADQPGARSWVEASNAHTRVVLEAQAEFSPEGASQRGLSRYDGHVADLGPRLDERYVAAMQTVIAELNRRLAAEKEPNVRQDLQILLEAVSDDVTAVRLNDKYYLDWYDAPQLVFGGIRGLLDEQVAPERRAKALEMLRRYVGRFPDTTPLTELAKARFDESRAVDRRGPYKASVEEAIANATTYAQGIRTLFGEHGIAGADDALAAMDAQFADYVAWQKAVVVPAARHDFRQPPELYAFLLELAGIDIAPERLIERAQTAFLETRAAMQALAPLVAKEKSFDILDYRAVIRRLKGDAIPNGELVAHYTAVNRKLEAVIRRERIAALPARPMVMRLASDAESAAQPAPHMKPPPLIGNTGERGEFVLPLANPSAARGGDAYDDFNFPAVAWTLSAHEGRPGHELQFTAMVERGVSQARSLFAFNSVNVEGWALYAEAEVLPYEPIEGQLIALQFRLLRAARAMLDPMVNLGLITPADAGRVLAEEVVLSPAMVRQEIDRYTFRAPGQAGSYFYGYTRLLQLRAETELALGDRFDRLAFNDFVLGQGLLPPALMAKAVREQLVPRQQAQAGRP